MLNILGLKSRNLITVPLDLPDVTVLGISCNEQRDVVITVVSTLVGTPCQPCGQPLTKRHGCDRWLELRHLSILGQWTYIRLQPQRYECAGCAGQTTTQTLAWYTSKSLHTQAYDDYLLLQLINSTVEDVSRKEAVGYDAVAGALARRIQGQVNWSAFTELGTLGI
ncbi:MAG: ISL3 family transposase, partial [Chloroflexi bacterium]|nr:ISL3 family transposase [Chloroflexota bacterium]